MTSSRQRNEGDRGKRRPFGKAKDARAGRDVEAGSQWLWGWHAVVAALRNAEREAPKRLVATAERAKALVEALGRRVEVEVLEMQAIGQLVPQGAVHQGLALKTAPLEPLSVEDVGAEASGVLLMLDSVTDPQNVGAIFRSAAAFGAKGIILQDRHAPAMTGALAKAAAGAVEVLPCAVVVNLSRALEKLTDMGWRAVGLDGSADETLAQVMDGRPTVIVLGSEGEGLRRLVAEHCDVLAKIPMPGGFESLNVSAAAAVALYEAVRGR